VSRTFDIVTGLTLRITDAEQPIAVPTPTGPPGGLAAGMKLVLAVRRCAPTCRAG